MAGDAGPLVDFHRVPERLVRQVSHIQQHADAVHFAKQALAVLIEPPFAARSEAIRGRPIVSGAEQSQTGSEPVLNLLWIKDGCAPFHAQDKPERRLSNGRFSGRKGEPFRQMLIECRLVVNFTEHTAGNHRAVIGKLPVSHGVTGFARLRKRQRFVFAMMAREQRRDDQPDSASLKLRPRYCTGPRNDLVVMLFKFSNFRNRKHQITNPFGCVPGHVEMGIKYEHANVLGIKGKQQSYVREIRIRDQPKLAKLGFSRKGLTKDYGNPWRLRLPERASRQGRQHHRSG